MEKHEFDRVVSQIREEHVADDVVDQAAKRIFANISAERAVDDAGQRLRVCADFQELIPAYAAKRLTPARALLMEDHLHACVACRHALEAARGETAPVVIHHRATTPRTPIFRWALVGALTVGIAIGIYAGNAGLLPGQHMTRATVQSIEGSLFAVAENGPRLITAGYKLTDGAEFRTAKGSRAEVKLADGSLIEIDERSQLSLSRGWRGTTIHLDGGNIIVQAARQRPGHLYVATDDSLVSSKGTVFLVDNGTKGSRVSVLEGAVDFSYGRHNQEVRAGAQATSNSNVSPVPLADEVAWSKDSAKYLALIGEFRTLAKQWEAIPGPGLRYQSNLLQYVPDNTVVYAAIPNLGSTLSEANRLFQDRLQQSPVLREWWTQNFGRNNRELQDVIGRLETFSSYLGDEVVVAIAKKGTDSYTAPVLLADVRKPGLPEFLEEQNQQLFGKDKQLGFQIVENPNALGPSANTPLLVYFANNIMVASIDPVELRRVAGLMQQSQAGGLTTPFQKKISQSYRDGAGWLFCVDMEQIFRSYVHDSRHARDLPPGFDNVQYLMIERRDVGKTETRASVTFAPRRQGIAAWLAEPAPMGSLDFVSPEASVAASLVIKDPKDLIDEMFQFAASSDPNFSQHLGEVESNLGVSIRNDISAPLGGEFTFAIDGPILPVPSWKLIVEVYDPGSLQSTISKLVDSFNRQAPPDAGKLLLSQRQVGSQTYFTLSSDKHPFELNYTFVDGYWLLGPSQSLLARAIQNRQTGYLLTRSQAFRDQLPTDGYTNFSAVLYHNLAPALTPLANQLKAMGAISPAEQHELDALQANSAPGLIYAYGEPDRIVVASSSGFMGLNLDSFLAIGAGKPLMLSELLGGDAGAPQNETARQHSHRVQ